MLVKPEKVHAVKKILANNKTINLIRFQQNCAKIGDMGALILICLFNQILNRIHYEWRNSLPDSIL